MQPEMLIPGQFAEFMRDSCCFSTALLTRVLDFLHLQNISIQNTFVIQPLKSKLNRMLENKLMLLYRVH